MKKRIWVSVLVLGVLCWGILTHLGREILPAAPLTNAWSIPFGSSSYHNVVSGLIPAGSDRTHVESILGEPDTEMVSVLGDSRFSLAYPIPHLSPGRELLISFGPDSRVLQIVQSAK